MLCPAIRPAKANVRSVPTAAVFGLSVANKISQQTDALPSIPAIGSNAMNKLEADKPRALPTEPNTSGGKYWIENSDSDIGFAG